MFSSLWQAERRPQNRAVLSLEHLETRACPAAPVVSAFSATVLYGTHIELSGTVQDENPSGVTVQFDGVANGFTTATSDGTFSFETDAANVGVITATANDGEGLFSNPASASITNNPPVISEFSVVNRGNGMWEIRGRVADEFASGLTVRITGLPSTGGSASYGTEGGSNDLFITVGEEGYFSSTIFLGEFSGVVGADTVDWWGTASETTYYLV